MKSNEFMQIIIIVNFDYIQFYRYIRMTDLFSIKQCRDLNNKTVYSTYDLRWLL